ncbi:UDP-GlcNAc3NAcA epimerase [Tenacibaculum mesophilum]|uniref:UDP-N-acetylglucosamine 2-epimerase (Non-hydrolyzing) n=1 Tax=Tenacibaculum mesophilum TaxID=104268 RepID=A0ABM7CFB6_9FLAO|nr:UDP-N-acetylglucosamine 2-epimerase (non-hydrolyzing) [Tenacibaculum mesophilum]AZJ32468.1 UDP-N-acetylglucosamine 2-epimerase (non-hydrolyzing) [Tenacibaculum mesophilum]QFS27721.1 UDP-N-acetylglucosamine 2-epimerase (non-hydrolyzing) [Tenacibaculum mesophilum]SHG15754.1 UDP-GlcNAc3NAcA epimerase [Tenacibaculum mesophilum]
MKILTILGARPQFIKAGSVSREILKHDTIQEIIIHTGQHYDKNMSDVFFDEMKIPKPDYFLGIGGKTHAVMTGQMMEKIEEIALEEAPDWILVYGDTNSTLAGAIVASKLHIKLAHIEAGLRSFNMKMPEEVNRILTDRVSNLLLCPTNTAVHNLKEEGYDNIDCKIVNTGDVMQDGAIFYKQFARKPKIDIKKNFILSTIHRAENTNDLYRLKNIFEAIEIIAKESQVILPLHPRTKKVLKENNIDLSTNITIIDPIGYLEMVWLINNCKLVMTDSGGLQKEAFFFEKPCVTLRDDTEWAGLVENKANILVGANKEAILDGYKTMKNANIDFSLNLFGGGKASEKIIREIKSYENIIIV